MLQIVFMWSSRMCWMAVSQRSIRQWNNNNNDSLSLATRRKFWSWLFFRFSPKMAHRSHSPARTLEAVIIVAGICSTLCCQQNEPAVEEVTFPPRGWRHPAGFYFAPSAAGCDCKTPQVSEHLCRKQMQWQVTNRDKSKLCSQVWSQARNYQCYYNHHI